MTRFEIPGGCAGSETVTGRGTALAGPGELSGVVVGAGVGSSRELVLAVSAGYRSGRAGATTGGSRGSGGESTAGGPGMPDPERRNRGAQIELSEIGLISLATQRVPEAIVERVEPRLQNGLPGMRHFPTNQTKPKAPNFQKICPRLSKKRTPLFLFSQSLSLSLPLSQQCA
jgi:hypothetical protein